MNRDEIQVFLPHREPMLLMDEAFPGNPGEASGSRLIRGDEFFLQGHFPGFPVVPGVILCEMIAQSAGVLVMDRLKEGLLPLFTGIEKVRFRRMVRPGDRVVTKCRMLRASGSLLKVAGEARVNGELCAEGVFLLMLTKGGA